MRIFLLIIILIITAVMLAGCWDFKQIDNYYLVTGIAIDEGDNPNELMVSVRISAPVTSLQTSSSFTKEGRVVSRKGKTILAAIEKMGNELKKELYLGHLEMLIVNSKVAEKNMNRVVNVFSRHPHIQRSLYLVITKNQAKTIISAINPLDVDPITDLANMFEINKNNFFIPVTLDSFVYKLKTKGANPILPIAGVNNKIIYVKGMAVFDSNKFIGELNGEETRALSMVIPKFTPEFITVNGPNYKNNPLDLINIETKSADTKIEVSIKDNKVIANIKINMIGRITEYATDNSKMTDEQLYEFAKNQLEDYFNKNLMNLIKKSKKYNSDILEIGRYVRANHMSYWDSIDWNEEYKKTEFKTNINVRIISSSSTKIKVD